MKNRKHILRLLVWSVLLSFALQLFSMGGNSEPIVSDWVDPLRVPSQIEITDAIAELSAALEWDGTRLEDGEVVPRDARLTASLSIRFADDLPLADLYVWTLPEAVLAEDTDWAPLAVGGRWRLSDGSVLLDLNGAALSADEGEVRFSFPFVPGDADQLVFPGCTLALRIAESAPAALAFAGDDFSVRLIPSADANLPQDAVLCVEEQLDTDPYLLRAAETLGIEAEKIRFIRAFDLSIRADDREYEPEGPVRVLMTLAAEGDRVVALHFADEELPPTRGDPQPLLRGAHRTGGVDVLDTEIADGEISFETDRFSVFAILGYRLETTVSASDGHTYQIAVTYGPEAGIPEGAALEADEIVPQPGGSDEPTVYDRYLEMAMEALEAEAPEDPYARFFDIRIVDEAGDIVQPDPGSVVNVSIALADADVGPLAVLHFGEAVDVLAASQDESDYGSTVSFETGSFSVYGIVEAPEPAEVEVRTVQNTSELTDGTGFYLSINGLSKYVSSSLNGNSCFVEVNSHTAAAVWYFEETSGGLLLYTLVDGEKQYLRNTANNNVGLSADSGTALVVTQAAAGKFYIGTTAQNKWLQHSGSGGGIRFWTDHNNAANSQFTISYASSYELPDDPYDLDGKSFGIAYNDQSAVAFGVTAEEKTASGQQRLNGRDLLIRPDVLNHDGVLLVAQGTDVPFWTFESVEGDRYYLKTSVGGETKYLTISGANVTLADEPDPNGASLITVRPGTGSDSGKWHFAAGNRALNFTGKTAKDFNGAAGTGASTWLNLLNESMLSDEDFQLYSAEKVSVAERPNALDEVKQVVLYTRIWNETTERYDFYVVDYDGSLVLCYDTGNGIEWIGSQVPTAVWNFTEYYDTEGAPTNFYELQNAQYGHYIAPLLESGRVFSNTMPGINLPGRTYGTNHTTVIAWDARSYAYAGLKAENGKVVPCPLSEADDFYFAMPSQTSPQPEDQLTEVPTVDNNLYGITMKMMDFNNPIVNSRDSVQNPFFGVRDNNQPGLLSTNLTNGYPMTTSLTGSVKPLSSLYTQMEPVNHLFLRSIYNESGYFEYDSTQNFAHLNEDGTFTVYDQIAAIGTASGPTRTHGQFMPYNELTPGLYATVTNRTDVTAEELPDLNPRKDEKLYLIPQDDADYFFGMELSAGFTQTPSGLDAWGHDIVFEFSGDDDFWLYVDGELVLDLGGVHSAMTGSVNFRTGVVRGRGGAVTSLYEIFRRNYQSRGLSESEIADLLNEKFEQNDAGQYVFKDYSNHDMRIFYMERGAGASNLHMRFNLAAVKPGTFNLSKKLSGTDDPENGLIEFPYQIWYKTTEDLEAQWHLLEETVVDPVGSIVPSVIYQGTNKPVTHLAEFTPANGTVPYEHVFILKPGESAEVTLPVSATVYRVTECGVNPDIYDSVSANGDPLTGADTANMIGGTARKDFTTPGDTLANRNKVEFDNHVRDGAMRTLQITKRLYDVDGVTPLHYPTDQTHFAYRLYLGNENANPASLPPANLYSYCVLDPNGFYCRWNTATQSFVSLGKTAYEQLTDAEREAATFTTSMYGSIAEIPADHTVEVRNLILGSQYKVEERDYEVPRGYTLRTGDGYTRVDVSPPVTTGSTPYAGLILRDEDPEIEIRNQIGWGLTVRKIWSDNDFMESHDPICFAVYLRQPDNSLILYEDSVRQLTSAADSGVYYFFFDLVYNGRTYHYNDYVIREVALTGEITVDGEGRVSGYTSITPVDEGGTLRAGGVPIGRTHEDYTYTVHYDVGSPTGRNENVREDVVTNARPGIPLYKIDENDRGLAGAVFSLTNEDGTDFAAGEYISDIDGLITIAYLAEGQYILTETVAPEGYVALDEPITITVDGDGGISLSPRSDLIRIIEDPEGAMIAVITIRNRPAGFIAKKADADTLEYLPGVHFALYRQVTTAEGDVRKDYFPMAGYEDLVTNENGIIPGISLDLGPGTYYLDETKAPDLYLDLTEDVIFTVNADGTVSMVNHPEWLERTEDGGAVSYSLVVPNVKPGPVATHVEGIKILQGRDMEAGEFTFIMTRVDLNGDPVPGAEPMTATVPAGRDGEAVPFRFGTMYFDAGDYSSAPYRDETGAYFYYIVEERISEDADEEGYDEGRRIAYDLSRYLVVIRMIQESDTFRLETSAYHYDGNGVPDALRPITAVPGLTPGTVSARRR